MTSVWPSVSVSLHQWICVEVVSTTLQPALTASAAGPSSFLGSWSSRKHSSDNANARTRYTPLDLWRCIPAILANLVVSLPMTTTNLLFARQVTLRIGRHTRSNWLSQRYSRRAHQPAEIELPSYPEIQLVHQSQSKTSLPGMNHFLLYTTTLDMQLQNPSESAQLQQASWSTENYRVRLRIICLFPLRIFKSQISNLATVERVSSWCQRPEVRWPFFDLHPLLVWHQQSFVHWPFFEHERSTASFASTLRSIGHGPDHVVNSMTIVCISVAIRMYDCAVKKQVFSQKSIWQKIASEMIAPLCCSLASLMLLSAGSRLRQECPFSKTILLSAFLGFWKVLLDPSAPSSDVTLPFLCSLYRVERCPALLNVV